MNYTISRIRGLTGTYEVLLTPTKRLLVVSIVRTRATYRGRKPYASKIKRVVDNEVLVQELVKERGREVWKTVESRRFKDPNRMKKYLMSLGVKEEDIKVGLDTLSLRYTAVKD